MTQALSLRGPQAEAISAEAEGDCFVADAPRSDRIDVISRQKIGYVTLLVRDQDEAIAFYTRVLRFDLIEDTLLAGGKRWVLVAPSGSSGACLLLAKAATSEQAGRIGNQTGGRVFLFLHTDDFWRDYREMRSRGIQFLEDPRQEPYGTVAVFVDLYGNRWDLLDLGDALPRAGSSV